MAGRPDRRRKARRLRRAPGRRAARSSTTHPNSSSRSWFPTARTATPTRRAPPPSTPCSPSPPAPPCRRLLVALAVRGVGSCWIGSTIFAAGPGARRARPAGGLGTARRHRDRPSGDEPAAASRVTAVPIRRAAGAADERCASRSSTSLTRLAGARSRHRTRCGTPCWRSCWPGPTPADARACPDTSRPRPLVLDHTGTQVLLTLHPRLGRWVQLGGHCEDPTTPTSPPRPCARPPRSPASTGCASAPAGRPACARRDLFAGRADPPPRHPVRRAGARRTPSITVSDESLDLRWWPLDDCRRRRLRPAQAVAGRGAAQTSVE